MDSDFNEATNYKLVGDDADITVTGVTENIDGEEIACTEISIPISNMNTVELAEGFKGKEFTDESIF
jgi:hypothetical protein